MYEHAHQITITQARQEASTIFLAKVFNLMTVGLALTGIVAFLTANTGLAAIIIGSPLFLILVLAELGLVFYLSARVEKIQAATASGLFIGYSVLNGLTLSVIFLAYTNTSIAGTFRGRTRHAGHRRSAEPPARSLPGPHGPRQEHHPGPPHRHGQHGTDRAATP